MLGTASPALETWYVLINTTLISRPWAAKGTPGVLWVVYRAKGTPGVLWVLGGTQSSFQTVIVLYGKPVQNGMTVWKPGYPAYGRRISAGTRICKTCTASLCKAPCDTAF